MAKYVGRRLVIGLAKESSRGTATEPTFWLGRNTFSYGDRTMTAREGEALGKIADSDANFVVGKHGEGEFEYDLDDKDIGVILTSLLGASPSTSGGPTYTHDYTLSNSNQHQALSLTVQDPNRTRIFPLAVVNSLSLTVEPETGLIKTTVGFMSRVGKDWTALSEDYTSRGNKFLHQHLSFKLASAVGSLAAASNISLKSLELNINANLVKDDVTGTVAPEDILNQQYSVEGSLTLNDEDDTYRNYMLDGTYRAMEIFFNRASSSSLKLQMPRVDFTEWEQDPALDTIATGAINFKGNYDAANALDIISTCDLINTYDGTDY